jgi:hypothetical protein
MHLLDREACDLDSLVVPSHHKTRVVDTDDRGIGGLDKNFPLIGYKLALLQQATGEGDVLSNNEDSGDALGLVP